MNASTDRLRTMLDSISSRQSLDEAILGLSGESVFRTTSSGSSFHDLLVGSFGGGDGGAGRGGADGGHSPLRSFSESRVSRPHSFLHGLGSGKLEGNHPLLPKRSSTASDGGEDEEDSQQRDANGGHEDDEDEDEQEEELPEPEKMSFVRRSTRMLTFKDKGGLAGCLKEAAANRKSLIEESGGLIPGTEEHRQEEWKRRARELASQSHARAQRRWLDAARRASSSSQNDEDKKILHFTDLVERIRKQSQGAADLNGRGFSVGPGGAGAAIDQLASSPGALTVLAPPPPGVLDHRIDPLAAAANLLHKPEVDLKEQRRRSSGFAGGQQGYVRFADATLRDPNYHLQFQDLLTQQGGKRRPSGSGEPESPGSDEGGGEGSSFATPSGEEDYPASRSAESVQRT
ncbi:hypothetical protein CSUI_007708 [Cystoisospora suis]|uniref:Uncharacterized protein n=1 Tax=Cystoisospora suis TaxID=483139 RepID=A0A2C6KPN2_9APIC|nr:hypothetical protein CSUI_007708 [Cystoisospora suis]